MLVPVMAHLSRMCGGAKPKLPSCADQVLWGMVFAAVTFYALLPTVAPLGYPYPWHVWVLSGISGLLAFLGKLTGHGRGISLFEPLRGNPEKVEVIVMLPRFINVIKTWLYKCIILALCEAIVWAGIALALSPWLILCALIRPAAYLIGWSIWDYAENKGLIRRTQDGKRSFRRIGFMPEYLGVHTAIGEFLTGAMAGMVLAYALSRII